LKAAIDNEPTLDSLAVPFETERVKSSPSRMVIDTSSLVK